MFEDFGKKFDRDAVRGVSIGLGTLTDIGANVMSGGLYGAGKGVVSGVKAIGDAMVPDAPAPVEASFINPSDVAGKASSEASARYKAEEQRLLDEFRRNPSPATFAAVRDFSSKKDTIIGETTAGLMKEFGARAAETAFGSPEAPKTFLEQERQALLASPQRAQQAALATQLMAQARGEGGPSQAELMLQRRSDDAMRQALALSRSQAGISPGLAARQAQQAGQQAQLGLSQQAAEMRAREQMEAQNLAAAILSQARQQDLGYLGAGGQLEQMRVGAGLTRAGMQQSIDIANMQAAAGAEIAGSQAITGLVGTGLSALATGGSMAFGGGK